MHHIISDGWSIGVLISEVTALYNAYRSGRPSSLAELAIQYADFAHWQREWLQGETLDKQLAYWKGQLAGAPSSLRLPLDRPRPQLTGSTGRSYSFRAGVETTSSIESLCRKEGMTPFIAVFAAFNVFLYRLTGQTDIVVGADVANRNWREVEDLIGFFVNLLALRTKLSGHSTFREVLGQVREVALGAYAHQDLPFDLLTRELRREGALDNNRIFDVLFVFQNFAVGSLEMHDAELALIPIDYETARFDLALFVEETSQGLSCRWTYRTDLFDDRTIAQLTGRFMKLLESILERPDACLDELDMLDPQERTEQESLQKLSLSKFKNLRSKTIAPSR
jgi:non-ribosomal peptide synthetase component F